MVAAAARELKVGRLINKTLDVLEKNWGIVLLYIVLLGAITSGLAYVGLSRTAILQQLGLAGASILIGTVVNYFLIRTLLKKSGLMGQGEGGHLVPFFGLTILYTLGVGLAFVVLIVPGLFVMARWSLARPHFVSRGGGVMESLSQSWDRTRGNEFPIIVAGLALAITFLAISIGAPFMFGQESFVGVVVSQLSGAIMTVIFAAFEVVLFGLIVAAHEVAGTFD
jgi:hypothetical protein